MTRVSAEETVRSWKTRVALLQEHQGIRMIGLERREPVQYDGECALMGGWGAVVVYSMIVPPEDES